MDMLSLLLTPAYAQLTEPPNVGLPTTELPRLILGVINWTLALVAVLVLAFLVYGGFLYITSRGDETQIGTAKQVIINAVIGIIVIGVAAALVNFVIDAVLRGGAGGGAPAGPPGGGGGGRGIR